MVYRLKTMKRRTKIVFILIVWIFSAICAVFGSFFIASAVIIPNTRAEIAYNPVLFEIREKMGDWVSFDYLDKSDPDSLYYPNIQLTFDEVEQRIIAITQENERIPGFRRRWIIEHRENGSVEFIPNPSRLEYYLFNGTIYAVELNPDFLRINFEYNEIIFDYDSGSSFKITRTLFESYNTTTGTVEVKVDAIGNAFVVRNLGILQWIQAVIREIWDYLLIEFLFIVEGVLLTVAIGGGLGILTAFILIFFRIARVFGGKYWTYFILKRLNGKLGTLLSFIPIFNFDGEFYVEERFVDEVDLSSVRSTLRELYKERWYDILIFPTALAAILTIIFVQNSELLNIESKLLALQWSPILSPIPLIILILYFPLVWSFNEGGFKRLEISPQGDVIATKPLGKILRDGIGIIIGFSGFVSLGTLGVDVGSTSDFSVKTSTAQIDVAGFTLDILGVAQLVLWTAGLFLVLLGSVIVGSSLLALNNLESSLLPAIKHLREKSAKDELITNWGTLGYQFSPIAKPVIYTKEDPKARKEQEL